MKPLFIFCCLLLALKSEAANDTLTRAQVYNFNVGDTFDYKCETVIHDDPFDGGNSDKISFMRVVIKTVQYFQFQDSLVILYYIYQIVPGGSNGPSTPYSIIDSTFHYVVFDVSDYCGYALCGITIDTGYNQRTVNQAVMCGGLGCYGDYISFANGLGMVSSVRYGGDGDAYSIQTDTTLIYYSKSGETWGIPASIAVGIPNIPQQTSSINLFPTVNNGEFKIRIDNANTESYQLTIYDLTGREMKKTNITNGTTNIALANASAGMYLWGVTSDGTIVKSGKLIIQ